MRIASKEFDTRHRTYIMGILNVTPDSFYDGGKHNSFDAAVRHAERMVQEGADILDVGGESTRPNFIKVSVQEEIDRTASLITELKKRFDAPVSIDTYKAAVAACAVAAGADIVNDVCGLKGDADMAGVVAQSGAVCVLGHNGGKDGTVNDSTAFVSEKGGYAANSTRDFGEKGGYADFLTGFDHDMQALIDTAKKAGINADKIILDPGIGFCKTTQESLCVLADFMRLPNGYPVLIGASNKSLIGKVLNVPASGRLYGTLATTAYAAMAGAAFVRVHDITENYQLIQMLTALKTIKNNCVQERS